jgi:hypothetical protein
MVRKGIEQRMVGKGIEQRAFETLEGARKECSSLLCSMELDLGRPLYLQGKTTAVSILPQPDPEQPGFCHLQILCHAAGHLNVDWERIPVVLTDPTAADPSERILGLNVLDTRGRTAFRVPFSPGRPFRLVEPEKSLELLVPLGDFPATLVAGFAGRAPSLPRFHAVSRDGRLEADASLKPGAPWPELHVVVRARHESLRNAEAHIIMRSKKSKALLFDARIPLDLDDGWAGGWQTTEDLGKLTEDAEMLVCVLGPRPPEVE